MALERLRVAKTEEDATQAYWEIDNVVIVQGALYEAALPTARSILPSITSAASVTAREKLIELLQQISAGETADGGESLVHEINKEVLRGFVVYVDLLQHGTELEREFCIELLMDCVDGEPALRDSVAFYFSQLLEDASASEHVHEFALVRLRELNGAGSP